MTKFRHKTAKKSFKDVSRHSSALMILMTQRKVTMIGLEEI